MGCAEPNPATIPPPLYKVWFAYVCCGCICRRLPSVASVASVRVVKAKEKSSNERTKPPTYSSRVSHGERTDDGRDVRSTAAAVIKQASERDADMTDASRRQRRFTVMFAAFAAPQQRRVKEEREKVVIQKSD